MKILGLNAGHNSAACVMVSGGLAAAAAEERFTRVKGCAGFPVNAIRYCLESQGLEPEDLDAVAVAGSYLPAIPQATYKKLMDGTGVVQKYMPGLGSVYRLARLPLANWVLSDMKNRRKRDLADFFRLKTDQIYGVDHHTCHAFSALFSSDYVREGKDVLVITADGGGDNRSSTVSTYVDGKLECKAWTDASTSIGVLYSETTRQLGMRVDEDEYKVMGLAPYAQNSKGEEQYQELSRIVRFEKEKLRFTSQVHSSRYIDYLRENFSRVRFDFLSYAVQKVAEELLLAIAKSSIERYKITDLACGGGVFMNVKANMKIAQLPEVSGMFVMPSAGDETNAVGAAYFVHEHLYPDIPIKPLKDLYLGPDFSDEEILGELERSSFEFEKSAKINQEIASLLSEHKVVARSSGRMEFGARALGNRSLLANPDDFAVVQEINRQIKGRDFWMPFAPVMMEQTAPDYLKSPDLGKVNSDTMVFAFETHEKARTELPAALHPYDKTARPQVLPKSVNPDYFEIIEEFRDETGIGGLLNTSFNLHGEPIARSVADALHTLESSGLQYLVLGDYVVSKKVKSNVPVNLA